MNIKKLKQDAADNAAAQAKLKAEGRRLLALAAPSDADTSRIDAINQELDTLAADAATIATRIAQAERFAADELAEASIVVGADRAEARPWGPSLPSTASAEMRAEAAVAGLGEFCIAVKKASSGEGYDPRLSAAASGMNSTTGADGGFAVPHEFAAGIEREMYDVGALLSRVDARSISGDGITYNVFDETSRVDGSRQGGVLGYWVDQGTAPTASQFKLARVEMKLRKVGALGYMTDELVADAAALGGELAGAFTDELVFQTENAIYRGTGAGQPLGILNASCLVTQTAEGSQTTDTINATNLVKMWARVPASSKRPGNGLAWLVNTDCMPTLHALSFPTASTEVAARFVTYGPDGTMSVFGRPVVEVEYASTVGDLGDIILADLTKYRVIRKSGVQQASSIHVRFAQGEQAFRAFYRVDGQPMPRSAVTPFKGSATKSPFVTLAAR